MLNKPLYYTLLASLTIILNGCTTIPKGPRVTALPGSNKTMMSFDQDRLRCKNFALRQSGGKTANQVKDDTTGKHAMVGTIVGALIGAAFGHHGAQSVAIGAATGMLFGAISGEDEGYIAGDDIQYRYDNAFTRCMYSAGHRVPVRIKYIEQPSVNITAPAPVEPIDLPDGTPYGVPPDFRPK